MEVRKIKKKDGVRKEGRKMSFRKKKGGEED